LSDDGSWAVRRQLAASIGELPQPARTQAAAAMLERYGSDRVVVDAVVSGLRGSEADVLDRLLQPGQTTQDDDGVSMLAAAIARSADTAAVQALIARATDGSRASWQRLALLQGVDLGLTAPVVRGRPSALSRVTISSEPGGMMRLATSDGEPGRIAKSILGKVDWPGKPAPAVELSPLTPEQEHRFNNGAELYKTVCVGCHQADGRGIEKLVPNLVESPYVTSPDAGAATRILLAGKEGQSGLMPPLGSTLNDEQIASLLTYVRRAWGHSASPVEAEDVREIRGMTRGRTRPWTDDELRQLRGRPR
jgi:mono/diheme cytochrome c family protein